LANGLERDFSFFSVQNWIILLGRRISGDENPQFSINYSSNDDVDGEVSAHAHARARNYWRKLITPGESKKSRF